MKKKRQKKKKKKDEEEVRNIVAAMVKYKRKNRIQMKKQKSESAAMHIPPVRNKGGAESEWRNSRRWNEATGGRTKKGRRDGRVGEGGAEGWD